MADLAYPSTLPGPTGWRHKRIESRQLRDLRDPANVNRLRARDYGANAQAEWIYTPAEMAIWKAWFEGVLSTQAARLRWFTARLPGRGGASTRVVRYMGPPQRQHVGQGNWRVTANLYVRGLAVNPQQDATALGGTETFELREDGTFELREDATFELRG